MTWQRWASGWPTGLKACITELRERLDNLTGSGGAVISPEEWEGMYVNVFNLMQMSGYRMLYVGDWFPAGGFQPQAVVSHAGKLWLNRASDATPEGLPAPGEVGSEIFWYPMS